MTRRVVTDILVIVGMILLALLITDPIGMYHHTNAAIDAVAGWGNGD